MPLSSAGKVSIASLDMHPGGDFMFTSKQAARTWVGAVVGLFAVLCISAPAAVAQCTLASADTWNVVGNGNWSDGGD